MHKDYLGNPILVGDEVIIPSFYGGPIGFTEGKVVKLTKKMVIVGKFERRLRPENCIVRSRPDGFNLGEINE